MDIRIDTTKARDTLGYAPQRLQNAILKWVLQGSRFTIDQMRNTLKERAKRNSAAGTAASIEAQMGAGVAVIGPPNRATKWGTFDPVWVDQPTRPHEIRPRFAKALAFARSGGQVGQRGVTRSGKPRLVTVFKVARPGKRASIRIGNVVFSRIVHHPGTKGLRFIEATTSRVEEPLQSLLERLIDEELREARSAGGIH